jgi:hypothetical protein
LASEPVSKTQAGHNPFGASLKIFSPQFSQTLIALVILLAA